MAKNMHEPDLLGIFCDGVTSRVTSLENLLTTLIEKMRIGQHVIGLIKIKRLCP
jgi:hypothetical protein